MTAPTVEQSEYLTTLEDVCSMLQKAQINMKKCPKQRLTEGYLKARLKSIDENWDIFKRAHHDLTTCTPKEQKTVIPYFLNEEYYRCEELYLNINADITDMLLKIQQRSTNLPTVSDESRLSVAKLPRIQLPTFSGKYEDWPSYQDLFVALVHNTSISDVQKLHYLKTSVTGEAEVLLRNIHITDNNYTHAWNLLKTRFGNKRMIANNIFKRLFGQKKVTNQSATQIKTLLDTTIECLSSLSNLNIKINYWDPIIIFLVCQKLDADSLKDWEEQAYRENSEDMPTWEDMKKFLQAKFRTLELIAPVTSISREKYSTTKSFHVTTEENDTDILQSASHFTTSTSQVCAYCKSNNHYIQSCKDFIELPVEERHSFVKKGNLCFNCMLPYHNVFLCKNKIRCRLCRRKHNILLHQNSENKTEEKKDTAEEIDQKQITEEETHPDHKFTNAHFSKEQTGHNVLLATALVRIKTEDGENHTFRALIDQGSEASFVSARVVELLNLPKTKINGIVSGVGEGNQISIKHLVNMSVASQYDQESEIQVKAYVLKTISTTLPSKRVKVNWSEPQFMQLADPTYDSPGRIDILLGADVFSRIIQEGLIKMADGIVAQKTTFGWIISGQQESTPKTNHSVVTLHVTSMVEEDNDLLRKFWEIETDSYKKKRLLTSEEEKCEIIYKATTKRDSSGRYTVQLPLKQKIDETIDLCGDTKQQAIIRFKQLEKKFQNNNHLKQEYTKVIREYLELGHMKRSEMLDTTPGIFLPHHAVIREDKDTTKVRVVFDASAKGKNGHSLNDTMMVGPVLQSDLRSLIITWRKYKICIVGDIVKMYRMINMKEDHTHLQRIVWRDNPDEDLEAYNLTTVSFGTAAAPFLSVRTLNQLADDEAHEFPETANIIKTAFYMDDLMAGHENEELTKKMCKEIKTVLNRGGFEMQKWSSNSEEVLNYLRGGNSSTKDKIEIKIDKIIKILGLTWDRKEDVFMITVNLPDIREPLTKRSILSDVARLFDPFGWLAPVIVNAKAFIQKLWLCKLGWDDKLPTDLKKDWIKYRKELIYLQNIKIPRWLKTTKNDNKEVQIHGFADASTQAYAAVAYLRIVQGDATRQNTEQNKIHVTMLASRTKIAPIKQLSVPKLELCAAALLAELINDLEELLNIPKDKIFAWTDSMVVLAWLQSHPSRWQTFVANRVADITRLVDSSCWRHIQTTDNPADVATRGVPAYELVDLEQWWNGPQWLQSNELDLNNSEIPETDLEMKKKMSYNITVQERPIWERFSDIQKMKRVLAYCRRMLRSNKIDTKYLNASELERVLEECIKYYQKVVYFREIEDLKKQKNVITRSPLRTLYPYLDEKGLLRVGGRLENANMAETAKHPIIIPPKQYITKLLIREAHIKTLHGGLQLMMAYVRSKYWIIGLKSAVKGYIRCCKTCVIDKARTKNQLMGQLPAMRVNPHRAFINSGVDYAGPVFIRTSKGRGHHATKGYICLFVCMSTRAIHLEAVTDLTSQAFIAAFRRFVARRGHCLNLWSDNGTNFIGASKELKDVFDKSKNSMTEEVAEILANDGTTAHFIPPRMPSYGGLWEAGVQSAKRHLARVNKDTRLTYEEMATLLAQIEACLNSRPLCLIDSTSESPLTPGHFLVGEPLIAVPDLNYINKKISILTRWQLIQRMTQDFWNRWQAEYLNTMQQRYKWQVAIPSPAIGDIVIIKEENMPPTKWLLGKIKNLHPGADGLVRVVTVGLKGNRELKRPLSKIIPLPTEAEYEL